MPKIPERLHEALESERGNLAKVEALLGCLALAIDYGDTDLSVAPDYGEVVKMACELIRGSVNRLDCLNLERLMPGRQKKAASKAAEETRPHPA